MVDPWLLPLFVHSVVGQCESWGSIRHHQTSSNVTKHQQTSSIINLFPWMTGFFLLSISMLQDHKTPWVMHFHDKPCQPVGSLTRRKWFTGRACWAFSLPVTTQSHFFPPPLVDAGFSFSKIVCCHQNYIDVYYSYIICMLIEYVQVYIYTLYIHILSMYLLPRSFHDVAILYLLPHILMRVEVETYADSCSEISQMSGEYTIICILMGLRLM